MELKRLEMGGYTGDVIGAAFGALRRNLIMGSADDLKPNFFNCWTDPEFMSSYEHTIAGLSNIRVVLVVRDGRALAFSSAVRGSLNGDWQNERSKDNFTGTLAEWNLEVEEQASVAYA